MSTALTCTLPVDYTIKISELINKTGCKYHRVDHLVNDENFPVENVCICCNNRVHKGAVEVDIHLLQPGVKVNKEQIKDDMEKQSLHPAGIRELLAFVDHCLADVYRHLLVVALGSECTDRDGHRYVPCFDGRYRDLIDVCWVEEIWTPFSGFLAVNK